MTSSQEEVQLARVFVSAAKKLQGDRKKFLEKALREYGTDDFRGGGGVSWPAPVEKHYRKLHALEREAWEQAVAHWRRAGRHGDPPGYEPYPRLVR